MSTSSPRSSSNFKNEREQLLENLRRLTSAILSKIFDLQPTAAIRRGQILFVLLLLSGFFISLRYYPLGLWVNYVQNIFLYFFNPVYRASYIGNPISSFILFCISAAIDPRNLQYLPIFLASFFIALQCAAVYITDIFELEDVSIARKFLWSVALTGSSDTIRFTDGHIAEKDRRSPMFLIGGPGKVIVDLDTAVLFEKADGKSRVIEPTGKIKGGGKQLDGFERYRVSINLRDQYSTLQEMEKAARDIKSRSLDGIRVSAVDVQIISSIFRDNQTPTDDNPYPFSSTSFENLVYEWPSRTTLDSNHPSTHTFTWEMIPRLMVRSELMKFMAGKKITEFLASFGIPEVERAREREAEIAEEVRQIVPPFEDLPKPREVKQPPPFTSRPDVSGLFNDFTNEFNKNANKRGVQFRWTGVGTWKTINMIPERHIGAWKLIKENLGQGSKEFIASKGNESGISKIVAMIQDVPMSYLDLMNSAPDRKTAIQTILEEYQRQLKDVDEFSRKNSRRIPPTLVASIAYLRQIILPARMVPRPPAVAKTQRESQLYEALLAKVGECNGVPLVQVVEQLEELERGFNPTATREQILEKVNQDWDLDIAGNWQT